MLVLHLEHGDHLEPELHRLEELHHARPARRMDPSEEAVGREEKELIRAVEYLSALTHPALSVVDVEKDVHRRQHVEQSLLDDAHLVLAGHPSVRQEHMVPARCTRCQCHSLVAPLQTQSPHSHRPTLGENGTRLKDEDSNGCAHHRQRGHDEEHQNLRGVRDVGVGEEGAHLERQQPNHSEYERRPTHRRQQPIPRVHVRRHMHLDDQREARNDEAQVELHQSSRLDQGEEACQNELACEYEEHPPAHMRVESLVQERKRTAELGRLRPSDDRVATRPKQRRKDQGHAHAVHQDRKPGRQQHRPWRRHDALRVAFDRQVGE